MKNPLRALLPIHALRESRALRHCHERNAAFELTLAAEMRAAADRARAERESNEAIAAAVAAVPMCAADAQWAVHRAAMLKQHAGDCERSLPALAEATHHALASRNEARRAHAATVRSHHKMREASRRVSSRDDSARSAAAEQRADEEFAPRWFANQPAPGA
jgi:hypothetical protein